MWTHQPTNNTHIPIGSMYTIYGNIDHQYTPNVSIYTIHGSYGIYIDPFWSPIPIPSRYPSIPETNVMDSAWIQPWRLCLLRARPFGAVERCRRTLHSSCRDTEIICNIVTITIVMPISSILSFLWKIMKDPRPGTFPHFFVGSLHAALPSSWCMLVLGLARNWARKQSTWESWKSYEVMWKSYGPHRFRVRAVESWNRGMDCILSSQGVKPDMKPEIPAEPSNLFTYNGHWTYICRSMYIPVGSMYGILYILYMYIC